MSDVLKHLIFMDIYSSSPVVMLATIHTGRTHYPISGVGGKPQFCRDESIIEAHNISYQLVNQEAEYIHQYTLSHAVTHAQVPLWEFHFMKGWMGVR